MKYNVATIREAGLDARWTKTINGAPIIAARDPEVGGGRWYVVCRDMWDRAKAVGIREAFVERCTLGEFFSIRA